MQNYKIIVGPAASGLSMIPVSTPRGMLNLRGGLILNQEEYKYAMSHGLGKLINAKIAIVISDKKAEKKLVIKKAEVKKETKAAKIEETVVAEEPAKVEEAIIVEEPVKETPKQEKKSKKK